MKKNIFFLAICLLVSLKMTSQSTGGVVITVTDSLTNQKIPGMGIFYFGVFGDKYLNDPSFNGTWFTDSSGVHVERLFQSTSAGDTVSAAVYDCNGKYYFKSAIIQTVSNGKDSAYIDFVIDCVPTSCDYYLADSIEEVVSPPRFWAKAFCLVDTNMYAPMGGVIDEWTLSDGSVYSSSQLRGSGANIDTSLAFGFCYSPTYGCNPICEGDSTPVVNNPVPVPNIVCNAKWELDTVNSIVMNGNVIVWDASSAADTIGDSVAIATYFWDFGDGNFSSQQYPTHTYADTGWHTLCLTITAINGVDTCTSTFCDSLGIDGNGNLLYKNGSASGFTIQVIDPATISLLEAVNMELTLYPNPTKKKINLSWNGEADALTIYNMSGVKVADYKIGGVHQKQINVENLPTGVYLINLTGNNSSETIRFIKQ